MQQLTRLQQVVSAASTVNDVVSDVTRKSQTFRYYTPPTAAQALTCYVHIAHARVHIHREAQDSVSIHAELQTPFAWRVASEQDDVGIYFVALRRQVVGGLGRATFTLTIPYHVHLILRLDSATLVLDKLNTTLELPSIDPQSPLQLKTL
jgi:hypothetical protein